jgi:hypothetical protein
MDDDHERFEALAVAHVVGGLGRGDAGTFRQHLRTCADCRSRILELRSIADELSAVARDARRRPEGPVPGRRVRTGPDEDATIPRLPWSRTAMIVVLALTVVGLAFWNLHLREAAAAYFAEADERGRVLEVLARGEAIDLTVIADARGRAARDGDTVAIVVPGLGPLTADERLVLWTAAPTQGEDQTPWRATLLAVGPAARVDVVELVRLEGATRIVVTVERGVVPSVPGADVVIAADLTP